MPSSPSLHGWQCGEMIPLVEFPLLPCRSIIYGEADPKRSLIRQREAHSKLLPEVIELHAVELSEH
jgi:hypothetical protein